MGNKPEIEAYVWWCGDEECDCHQPVIEEVYEKKVGRLIIYQRKRLWEGTFISQPDPDELRQLDQELKDEREKTQYQHGGDA